MSRMGSRSQARDYATGGEGLAESEMSCRPRGETGAATGQLRDPEAGIKYFNRSEQQAVLHVVLKDRLIGGDDEDRSSPDLRYKRQSVCDFSGEPLVSLLPVARIRLPVSALRLSLGSRYRC